MAWTNTLILDKTTGFATAVIPWENPVWADAAKTTITVTMHHPVFGAIPFTIDPNDTGASFDVKQLFDAITAAETATPGTIAAYPGP